MLRVCGSPGRRLSRAALPLVSLAAGVILPLSSGTPATAATSVEAGNYLGDAAHSGVVNGAGLTTPLSPAWATGGLGGVGGVVFGDGNAYVGSRVGYATYITALRSTDGSVMWGPYQVSADRDWDGVAYENGRVFVVDWYCHVVAYDALSGHKDWETAGNGDMCYAPPTTSGGVLYIGGEGGTVVAYDEATGHVRWTGTGAGGPSSPAVSGGMVVLDPSSLQVTADRISNGTTAWRFQSRITGGGGRTAVIAGGKVYARSSTDRTMQVLDLATGQSLGTIPSDGPPAVDAARGIILTQIQPVSGRVGCGPCSVVARSLSTGAVLWTFKGDGQLVVPPLVSDGVVYTASQGDNVYGLDEQTGAVVWSADLRTNATANDEQNANQSTAFLGVGDGLLTVTTGDGIVAFHTSSTSQVAPIEHSWNGSYGACSEDGSPHGGTCYWPFTQTVTGADLVHLSWNKDYGATFTARVLNPNGSWVASTSSTSGDIYLSTKSLPAGSSYKIEIINGMQANLLFTVHFSENQPRLGKRAAATLSPAALAFGVVPVASYSGRAVMITNTGGQDLAVGHLSLASGTSKALARSFDACSGGLLPPGWSCTARVLAHPATAGPISGTLVVPTSGGQQTVPLTGSTS